MKAEVIWEEDCEKKEGQLFMGVTCETKNVFPRSIKHERIAVMLKRQVYKRRRTQYSTLAEIQQLKTLRRSQNDR